MLRKTLLACLSATLIASCATPSNISDRGETSFSKRLSIPRIPPVDPKDPALNQAQKDLLASRPDYNLYKTLAHHTDLYSHWSPMGRFILNGSTLQPRHREIVMLRMGWLCQAEYEWAQHARIARDDVGFSDEEIRAVAVGTDAGIWNTVEQALIQMVDDLRYQSEISQPVWTVLASNFNEREIMELVYTAGQYQLVSMVLNSTGIQLDPILDHRLPSDLRLPPLAEKAEAPKFAGQRLTLQSFDEMSPEQQEAVSAYNRDGNIPGLFAMLSKNPNLMTSHMGFVRFLNTKSGLSDRERELAILRTAALVGIEYEWSYHSRSALRAGLTEAEVQAVMTGSAASGWSAEDSAILRAAEDLRREAFITDETWADLSDFLTPKEQFELVFLVGAYALNGLTLNAFGVPLDEGMTGFPG